MSAYDMHPGFEWEHDEILMCYCSESTYPGLPHTHGQSEHEQERKRFYKTIANAIETENENAETILRNFSGCGKSISSSGLLDEGEENQWNSIEKVPDSVWEQLRVASQGTSDNRKESRTTNRNRTKRRVTDGNKRLQVRRPRTK